MALNLLENFTRPNAPYQKEHKARDLTLLRSPFPPRVGGGAPALTPEQVARIVTPQADRRQAPNADGDGNTDVAAQLKELRELLQLQQTKISTQEATIRQLFDAQADQTEGEVASSYEVTEEVMEFLGKGPDGCSWMNIHPLAQKDRNRLLREHGGTFKEFPMELDLIEATKMRTDVQKVTIPLQQFAQKEVSKYMLRNSCTIKMCGTVFSRVIEMRKEVEASLEASPDNNMVPTADVLEFLKVLDGASSAALQLAVDTQTHIRLAVSSRIEKAMGVGHLRRDPFKKEKEDFIAPDTYKLIEEAAVKKQNLQWAQDALKKDVAVGSKHGSGGLSHGRPSSKSSGGGKQNKSFDKYKSSGGNKNTQKKPWVKKPDGGNKQKEGNG